jgi:hypothetical protein
VYSLYVLYTHACAVFLLADIIQENYCVNTPWWLLGMYPTSRRRERGGSVSNGD